jgi:hypothetical protein
MRTVEKALSYGGPEITVSKGTIESITAAGKVNPWVVAAKVIGTIVFPVFVLIAFCIREVYRKVVIRDLSQSVKEQVIIKAKRKFEAELASIETQLTTCPEWALEFNELKLNYVIPFIEPCLDNYTNALASLFQSNQSNQEILKILQAHVIGIKPLEIKKSLTEAAFKNTPPQISSSITRWHTMVQIRDKINLSCDHAKNKLDGLLAKIDHQLRLPEINKNLDILLNRSTGNPDAFKEAWLYIYGFGDPSQKSLATDLYRSILSPEGQADLDAAINRPVPEATPFE